MEEFHSQATIPSKKGPREYIPDLTLFFPAGDFYLQRKGNLLVQSIQVSIPGYRVHMTGEWNWKGSEKMPMYHSPNTEKQKVPLFQGFSLW